MQIISDTTQFHIEEPTAVAVGKFDGLHLGHRELLSVILAARENGLKAAVFTFDPSPGVFFQRQKMKSGLPEPEASLQTEDGFKELMTREEKRLRFEQMGVDYLVEYPFCAETAAVSPEDYVNRFLLDQMHARLIAAGEDVSFGKGGAGNAALLKDRIDKRNKAASGSGKEETVSLCVIPKICWQGQEISSTLVREYVKKGEMETAAQLLGEAYSINGIVSEGNRLGRNLGMPTANLYPEAGKLLPPNGVYFSRVLLYTEGTERIFRGITNIGYKPTIQGSAPKMGVETNLFDFDEDIYGQRIQVQLQHFHRPEKKFGSLQELTEQMKKDAKAREAWTEAV